MPPKRRSEQLKRARCSIGGASVQVTHGDDDDDDSDDDDDIDEQDLFLEKKTNRSRLSVSVVINDSNSSGAIFLAWCGSGSSSTFKFNVQVQSGAACFRHHVQCQTLDCVGFDTTVPVFSYGSLFVALSRTRTVLPSSSVATARPGSRR